MAPNRISTKRTARAHRIASGRRSARRRPRAVSGPEADILAPSDRLCIVVLGYIVRGPLGGMVWSNLQYLLGLTRLGHEVYFFEDSDDYPSCYDPAAGRTDIDPSYGLAFARRVFDRLGLGERWAYHDAHRGVWHGPVADHAVRIGMRADLLLDLCGVNPLRPWLRNIPIRALVDEDPAFTQIRHLTDPDALRRARLHNVFFTFGENIPSGRSTVPDDGLPWIATRQPVVLDMIRPSPGPRQGRFTTLMQWESYPAREWHGVRYGMKSDSFTPYLDLPARAGPCLELALGGPTAPRDELGAHGWIVTDPREPSRDPWSYQHFVARSKAEWSVAKHGYAVTRCGWFSERSAAYMATGRPVVVQETGYSDHLPIGDGLLAFATPEAAAAAIAEVNARYSYHCTAAREIAQRYFDSRRILTELIEHCQRAVGGPRPAT